MTWSLEWNVRVNLWILNYKITLIRLSQFCCIMKFLQKLMYEMKITYVFSALTFSLRLSVVLVHDIWFTLEPYNNLSIFSIKGEWIHFIYTTTHFHNNKTITFVFSFTHRFYWLPLWKKKWLSLIVNMVQTNKTLYFFWKLLYCIKNELN